MYQQPNMMQYGQGQQMPGQQFVSAQPQMRGGAVYGGYGGQGYPVQSSGFAGPAMYQQGGFNQQAGFGRGAGGFRGGGGGFGNRGGFGGGFGRGGAGARGRKKPFVGGSLETQRDWERANLCCFFLQGSCKFGDRCRFSHEDDGIRRCHFGLSCRLGHQNRPGSAEQQAHDAQQAAQQQAQGEPTQ